MSIQCLDGPKCIISRKEHICDVTGETIPKKAMYWTRTMVDGLSMYSFKTSLFGEWIFCRYEDSYEMGLSTGDVALEYAISEFGCIGLARKHFQNFFMLDFLAEYKALGVYSDPEEY